MISFNNIPDNLRVPLFYAEMDNSQANTATSPMRRLVIAQVNDNSTASEINQVTLINSEAYATSIGGPGSMLSAMVNTWRAIDPMGELWALPLQNTTGSVATGSITFGGTAAEGGLINLYIAGTRIRVNVVTGDDGAAIASAVTAAVNAAVELPVVATVSEAVVTLSCKWTGVSGNDLQLSINYRGAAADEFTPAGVTTTINAMSNGVGAPDLTAALAVLGDEPFEFICIPWTDTASLDAVKDLMNDTAGRWSYLKQDYGHVYSAKRGTVGELVALGIVPNNQHLTISGLEQKAPQPFWLWAAAYTARTAVFISNDVSRPTQTGELNGIMPAATGRFTKLERQLLLNNGIATSYYEGGSVRIERAITTYRVNNYGQADNSYLDSETLHQSAYIINFLKTRITSKYGRHKLANDGTRFSAGQAIVTPAVIRGELIAAYAELESMGHVENMDAFQEHLIVERNATNPNRIDVLFTPDYVNQLRIFALLNQFRLQMSDIAAA